MVETKPDNVYMREMIMFWEQKCMFKTWFLVYRHLQCMQETQPDDDLAGKEVLGVKMYAEDMDCRRETCKTLSG